MFKDCTALRLNFRLGIVKRCSYFLEIFILFSITHELYFETKEILFNCILQLLYNVVS